MLSLLHTFIVVYILDPLITDENTPMTITDKTPMLSKTTTNRHVCIFLSYTIIYYLLLIFLHIHEGNDEEYW